MQQKDFFGYEHPCHTTCFPLEMWLNLEFIWMKTLFVCFVNSPNSITLKLNSNNYLPSSDIWLKLFNGAWTLGGGKLFTTSDSKLGLINGEVRGLYDSEGLSQLLMSSHPTPSPLHPHAFKHLITDELQGGGFSNISLTPSLVGPVPPAGWEQLGKSGPASCQSSYLRHLPHDCDECRRETAQLYNLLKRYTNLDQISKGSLVF